MARDAAIEKKRLWELARQGKSVEEMMAVLDIREMDALKQSLEDLFREKGESVPVPGLIGRAGLRATYTDEGIRIDPAMLEGSGFRAGDEFDLEVAGDRISLQMRKRPPVPGGKEDRNE